MESEFYTGPLVWESAGTDEPGDQNASTYLYPHGYWSLGPDRDNGWAVEVIETNEHGDEMPLGGAALGWFATEAEAKAAAQAYESVPY